MATSSSGFARVAGTVGGSLRDLARSSDPSVAGASRAGLYGEEATGGLLDRVLATVEFERPGRSDVFIRHDLRVPGAEGRHRAVNVDHIVIRDRRVLIVDSKVWKSGFYWGTTGIGIRRGLTRLPHVERQSIYPSMRQWQSYLDRSVRGRVQVTGLLVVHPPRGAVAPSLWAVRLDEGVGLLGAEAAEKALVRFARSGLTSKPPTADLLAAVDRQLIGGPRRP